MSKNISDNNNAAMLLTSHVQSNVTHVRDIRDLQITLCIIIQTIRIKKYFELMLRIT